MSKPIVLIFGAGSRVGKGLTDGFANAGYRVATINRSAPEKPTISTSGQELSIRADVSQPAQIPPVFEQVRKTWGAAPSVVVWNAASFSVVPDQSNIFTLGLDAINNDIALMITSPFVAAREAVEGWKTDNLAGRFIMTGNCLPRSILPIPNLTTSGIGKAGGAYWVGQADALYKSKGWRFFFADERFANGQPTGNSVNPESHAKMYLHLADKPADDIPYYATFVDGEYRHFDLIEKVSL